MMFQYLQNCRLDFLVAKIPDIALGEKYRLEQGIYIVMPIVEIKDVVQWGL